MEMEKNKKMLALISAALVAVFAFSYGVGYFVGRQAGIKAERQKCEMEKKQLVKTFAQLTPVSRPQPEIETKVVPPPIPTENQETTSAREKAEIKKEKVEVETPKPEKTPVLEKEAKESKVEPVEEKKEGKESKALPVTTVSKSEPVKKSSPHNEATEKKVYFLQLGVFKDKTNAARFAERLKAKGFDAKTEYYKGYARVIVGYFKSLQEAKAVQRELLKAGYKSIIRWRDC